MRIGLLTFLAGIAFVTTLVGPQRAQAQVTLIDTGVGRAVIVIAEKPPRTVKLAAEELQTYLAKLTGARLPIVTQPDSPTAARIYVGKSSFTDSQNIRTDDLQHGAYRIVTGDNWLALVGNDRDTFIPGPWPRDRNKVDDFIKQWDQITGEHFASPMAAMWRKLDQTPNGTGLWEADADNAGSFFAVTKLLRDQGVRWYMPGDVGEIVPKVSTIIIPKQNILSKPDFALRNLYVFGSNFHTGNRERILWQLRIGANQGLETLGLTTNVSVAHGTSNVISRDETKKAHPEYYAHRGGEPITQSLMGKEGPGVPCLVSKPLIDANVRYVRATLDTFKLTSVSVGPTDGFTFLCECPEARAFAAPQRGWYGSMSDYAWDYMVKVAQGVAQTHPDRKIHGLAYSTYQLPPQHITKLPPNLIVGIAQARVYFGDTAQRDRMRDLRTQWLSRITSGVPLYQYEYYLQGWRKDIYQGVPVYFTGLITEDLRSLKTISMGDYIEIFPSPANYLNTYVTAQLLWDVDQNVPAMIDEFVTLFYGPAAGAMREFINYSEQNWTRIPKSKTEIDKVFSLITAARAAAGDTIYGQRVDLMIEYMKPLLKQKAALDIVRANTGTITAPTVTDAQVIDGKLDEPFWQTLPVYEFKSTTPDAKPGVPTTVRMGWRDGAVILGIHCAEPLMKQVNLGHTRNDDTNWFHYDGVEIMVETPQYSHYQMGISPTGAMTDLGRMGAPEYEWSSEAVVKSHIGDDFYSIEIRLPAAGADRFVLEPLNGIAGDKPTAAAPWFINVGRLRLVGQRETQSLSGAGFHDKTKFLQLQVKE